MSGEEQRPACITPVAEHAEELHLYANGLLCDWHAPWAMAGRPRPTVPTAHEGPAT